MAQFATISVLMVLLTSHAMADILVQPGYGQPRTPSESHLTKQQHQQQQQKSLIVQPPETLPSLEQEDQQEQDYMDPGYHLELHPVYTDSYHIPAYALSPFLQQPYGRPMSKAAYRRLLAKNGYMGPPTMISPQYYQYSPTPVHNRNRRSNTEELVAAAQRDKRDKDDVATKPSLNDGTLSVVDLQNQDEKRVNTRQSATTGTLLGLNPANMYPMYQQYNPAELDITSNPQQQEIADQQTHSQVNSREATRSRIAMQQQSATPVKTSIPRVKLENLQHAMLLQQSAPKQQQQEQISDQRNYADSRPISVSVQSAPSSITSKQYIKYHTPTVPKEIGTSTNLKLVGSTKHGGLQTLKVVKYSHQHATLKNNDHKLEESYTDADPSYVVYNDGTPDNLATAQTSGVPAAVQPYQLPGVYDTNYSPNTQYVLVPQTYPASYPGDYAANYVWGYPCSSTPSTYKIYFTTPYSVQPTMYQYVRFV